VVRYSVWPLGDRRCATPATIWPFLVPARYRSPGSPLIPPQCRYWKALDHPHMGRELGKILRRQQMIIRGLGEGRRRKRRSRKQKIKFREMCHAVHPGQSVCSYHLHRGREHTSLRAYFSHPLRGQNAGRPGSIGKKLPGVSYGRRIAMGDGDAPVFSNTNRCPDGAAVIRLAMASQASRRVVAAPGVVPGGILVANKTEGGFTSRRCARSGGWPISRRCMRPENCPQQIILDPEQDAPTLRTPAPISPPAHPIHHRVVVVRRGAFQCRRPATVTRAAAPIINIMKTRILLL